MSKFAKGNNSTIEFFLFLFSPGNLLIILYKLTKFEALAVIVFEIRVHTDLTKQNSLTFP